MKPLLAITRFVLLLFFVGYAAMPMRAQLDVNRVMRIGQNALYFKDYMVSISYFNQVIAVRPWMAEPYYYRAACKFMLGDYRGAEQDASEALSRNAFLTRAYVLRGIARTHLKQEQGAIQDLAYVYSITPDDMEIGLNLASVQLGAKQLSAADTTLQKLMKRHTQNAPLQLLYAEALLQKRDTLQATEAVTRALRVDSTFAQAYAYRAMIAASSHRYAPALGDLNEAIRLAPDEKQHYLNRGLVYYHLNRFQEAITDYTTAITLAPEDAVPYYNRALLRATVGDNNRALEDFNQVLRRQPQNYMALYNKGLLSLEVGDYRSALESFNRVLARYPHFQLGLLARADAKRGLGDNAGADRDAWQAYQQQKGRTKVTPPKNAKETRTESDETIERYNQLVQSNASPLAIDNPNSLPQSLRGRVQDQEVALMPLPPFGLTYYHAPARAGFAPRSYNAPLLTTYNEGYPQEQPLLIGSIDQPLDTVALTALQQKLTQLQAQELSRNPALLFRRGVAAMLLIDLENALADFERALSLQPDPTLKQLLLFACATTRLRVHGLQLSSQESPRWETSVAAPTNALGVSLPQPTAPKSVSLLPVHGLKTALQELDQLIELSPTFVYAYYNRALLYEALGEPSKAYDDYTRVIQYAQDRVPQAYFNRALLHLSMGRRNEAILDLSNAGQGGVYQAYNLLKRIQQP